MKYNAEEIGKRIEKERKNMKISQDKLGEMLHVVNKQISNYENGKLIPPIKALFELCNIFNCELGYLLGEEAYSAGTQLDTAIENTTGLKKETIDAIIKITGKERSCIEWGHQSENYKKILNNFLTSEKFLDIMKIMLELDTIYNQKNTEMEELQNELGDELFNKSINLYQSDYINLNLTQEECEAIAKIDNVIDNCHEKNLIFQREMAFNRFKLQEAFTLLLNELYPNKEY